MKILSLIKALVVVLVVVNEAALLG